MNAKPLIATGLFAALLLAFAAVRCTEPAPLSIDDAGPALDGGPAEDVIEGIPDVPTIVPPPPMEPPPPPPPDPPEASLEAAIAPGAPESVTVLAQRPYHSDVFVLAALDRSRPAAAAEGELEDETEDDETETEQDETETEQDETETDQDETEESIEGEDDDESAEPCSDEEAGDDVYCECLQRSSASPDEGWRIALGQPVVRLMVVRVTTEAGAFRVTARRELTGPVLLDPLPEPPEIRLTDIDGDGRVEATVLVSFGVPDCDTFDDVAGTLGVILDGTDLHEEAAFTRELSRSGGDSDVNSETRRTVWLAAHDDAGAPVLRVRETWTTSESDPPDFDAREARGEQIVVCTYDAAEDRYRCPQPIGQMLVELARTDMR